MHYNFHQLRRVNLKGGEANSSPACAECASVPPPRCCMLHPQLHACITIHTQGATFSQQPQQSSTRQGQMAAATTPAGLLALAERCLAGVLQFEAEGRAPDWYDGACTALDDALCADHLLNAPLPGDGAIWSRLVQQAGGG